jgi:hypothetical protein
MLRPFKIPTMALFVTVALLAVGEVATGTQPAFAAWVAGTLVCIGVTYNLLGGLSTISGIAFSGFAACTIVISQFAKVILAEPANIPLESPYLTIQVYFVFYLCVLIGTFVYRSLRVRLPQPLEPATLAQADVQYTISLVVGLVAEFLYESTEASTNAGERASTAHSIGLAFAPLLLFSIVLAVQNRIRSSGARHSFNVKAFIPWFATVIFGFLQTSRGHILLPSIVYGFTCYTSGYRFHRKHYAVALAGAVFFLLVVSPYEIFVRGAMKELDFSGRVSHSVDFLRSMPDWSVVQEASSGGVDSDSREEYYMRPGTFVLSRLSAIRADSNMINACSQGFHYGFTALSIDIRHNLPRFLAKDKPEFDGAAYTGRITGVNPDEIPNGEFLITAVGDSFGAFGWLGVMVVALIGFPTVFIIYESMFDMRKPWGIVAAGSFCFQFSQIGMSGILMLAVRSTTSILLLSYLMGALVRMIPVRGDQGAPTLKEEEPWDLDVDGAGQLDA